MILHKTGTSIIRSYHVFSIERISNPNLVFNELAFETRG